MVWDRENRQWEIWGGHGEERLLLELRHRAMACEFVLLVRDENARVGGKSVVDAALAHLEKTGEIEAVLSVYQATSEISRVNALAAERPVHVSELTFGLLRRASELSSATGGAFDVTAGPLVDAWGFTRRDGRKPSPAEIETARQCVGWQSLTLDENDRSVRFAKPGMAINLGAIGKGEAIDRLASRLKDDGIKDFLIHAGQSSVLASGDQHKPETTDSDEATSEVTSEAISEATRRRGWLVGVAHPTRPGRRLCGLWLRDEALSTSGSGKQFFHHKGKRYGHVIDPRTGVPAGQWLSLTMITANAVDADALATGLYVMGNDEAKAYASSHNAKLILVGAGKRQDEVAVDTVGQFQWEDPPKDPNQPNASEWNDRN